jgi:hypothetical protein
MSRVRLIIAVCCGIMACSALTSTAAFAGGQWDVNGTALSGTTPILSFALVLSPGRFFIHGFGLSIVCRGSQVSFNEGLLKAPDGVSVKDLTFNECKIEESESCTLSNGKLLSVPIHGLAYLDNGERLNTTILLLPQTKNTFFTFKFEGENCPFAGVQSVTGGLDLLIDEGYLPAVEHLVLSQILKGELKLGSSEVLLEKLDADMRLASGLPWNFL